MKPGKEAGVVEDDAEDSGLALVEVTHCVKGVGRGDGSGADTGLGDGGGGVAVSNADAHPQAEAWAMTSSGIGQLGSDGHEAEVSLGGLPEAIEEGDGGREQEFGRVNAALLVREKWALEVNADGDRFAGRLRPTSRPRPESEARVVSIEAVTVVARYPATP